MQIAATRGSVEHSFGLWPTSHATSAAPGCGVGTEHGNAAAIACYRAAGVSPPEQFVTLEWAFADR